jgi:hypothetical protein
VLDLEHGGKVLCRIGDDESTTHTDRLSRATDISAAIPAAARALVKHQLRSDN